MVEGEVGETGSQLQWDEEEPETTKKKGNKNRVKLIIILEKTGVVDKAGIKTL